MSRLTRMTKLISKILTFCIVACFVTSFLSKVSLTSDDDDNQQQKLHRVGQGNGHLLRRDFRESLQDTGQDGNNNDLLVDKKSGQRGIQSPSMTKDENDEAFVPFAKIADEMKLFVKNYKENHRQIKSVEVEEEVNYSLYSSGPSDSDFGENVKPYFGRDIPVICLKNGNQNNYVVMKASIIVSLAHLGTCDPVVLLYRILYRIPDHVTDDVIITAEDHLNVDMKERLEVAVDLCSRCRLFFFQGPIYEHRNRAAKFARAQKLVFIDARVTPADGWIEPLLLELNYNPQVVVCPHLHLCKTGDKKYAKSPIKSVVCDIGLSRMEMTWDLHSIRAPLTNDQKKLVADERAIAVNQTVILKEVMAIHKDLFLQLGGFDMVPAASGGEHVSFSLKVLNCDGEILMSACSKVFLDATGILEGRSTLQLSTNDIINGQQETFFVRDYPSPSFRERKKNVSEYFEATHDLWLDAFSAKIYSESPHRKIAISSAAVISSDLEFRSDSRFRRARYSKAQRNSQYTRFWRVSQAFKTSLISMECELANFRYVITKYQVNTISPSRTVTHYGYVRSLDGIFAVGLSPKASLLGDSYAFKIPNRLSNYLKAGGDKKDLNNWMTFTRDASLWVGPLSYLNGQIQFRLIWCLTVIERQDSQSIAQFPRVGVKLCNSNSRLQSFLFLDGHFRWAENGGKSCIKVDEKEDRLSLSSTSLSSLSLSPLSPSKFQSGSSPAPEVASKYLVVAPCDAIQPNMTNVRFVFDMEFEFDKT